MQTLLVAGVWFALQAAAPSGEVMRIDWSRLADRTSELATTRAAYVAALNAGDAGGASAIYAADALAIFGDAVILRGRAALSARLQNGPGGPSETVTLVPRSFVESQGLGTETGTFSVLRGDNSLPVDGAYIAVYSREGGGRWRIVMEVRTGYGKW
jgi:ketosteroid isomerase-like protein